MDALSRSGIKKRPNIVFIIADDLGYADVSCDDSEVLSPWLAYTRSKGLCRIHLGSHRVGKTVLCAHPT
jgi:arylsulfatase A-like enzyme